MLGAAKAAVLSNPASKKIRMGKRYTKAQILEAISKSGGVMSVVQQRLGCKSWRTARTYVEKWAETQEAWESENELTDDLAQSVIIKDMQNGNVQTAKWWLERRRRKAFCISDKAQITQQDEETDDNELTIEIMDGGDED